MKFKVILSLINLRFSFIFIKNKKSYTNYHKYADNILLFCIIFYIVIAISWYY